MGVSMVLPGMVYLLQATYMWSQVGRDRSVRLNADGDTAACRSRSRSRRMVVKRMLAKYLTALALLLAVIVAVG
jgi:hypothetical protein